MPSAASLTKKFVYANLFKALDVLEGLKPDGFLLVNTNKNFADIHVSTIFTRVREDHVCTVLATDLAVSHIG